MKTRTPFSSVILYLLGIIFMIVSAFMLVTAISYTKMYLASYETTFEEMWSNSVQYIIEKFLPYFAAGVICFGLGKAISVFKKGLGAAAGSSLATGMGAGTVADAVEPKVASDIAMSIREMREVNSIKLEEMERREKVRLEDLRENVVRDMAIHRLQREAKEEEILSKLNALGEKMGLDMAELYAKADIPVVPETEPSTEKVAEEDPLKDDPLFDELEEIGDSDEQVLTHADEPGKPEQIEEADEEAEEAEVEVEEAEEADDEETVEEETGEEVEETEETEEAEAEEEETVEEVEEAEEETDDEEEDADDESEEVEEDDDESEEAEDDEEAEEEEEADDESEEAEDDEEAEAEEEADDESDEADDDEEAEEEEEADDESEEAEDAEESDDTNDEVAEDAVVDTEDLVAEFEETIEEEADDAPDFKPEKRSFLDRFRSKKNRNS